MTPTSVLPSRCDFSEAKRRVRDAFDRTRGDAHPAVWITRFERDRIDQQLATLQRRLDAAGPEPLPLLGQTFAIKDNIDFAGAPTTAACPAFAYTPERSATVVQRLLDAGAVALGKTNLDQFATGLVGTRSPYGACPNAFDRRYISGGSSSGSAVAVARGLVDFSLGTDTAGSGRVPAAFNDLVGYKPTRGFISTSGVVPACRSLDCVSIFARTVDGAKQVAGVAVDFDERDPFSRRVKEVPAVGASTSGPLRVGVPDASQLEFFGDPVARDHFAAAVDRVRGSGAEVCTIDYTPFRQAAELLYQGPWVAERLAAIETFFAAHSDQMFDVTRTIIGGASRFDAVSTFKAMYRLQALRRETEASWQAMDLLLLPTTGTIYTLDALRADPIGLNTNLGYYTNFVNLLDLAAIAVPAGFRSDGLPAGITFLAPAGADDFLFGAARRLGFEGRAA